MRKSRSQLRFRLAFLWGFVLAPMAAAFMGCIDDRPSGPGRIRDTGGAPSESSGGGSSSGGSVASGGSSHSQSSSSGGQAGAGESASASSASAGHAGGSSQSASLSAAAGSGGASASSQAAGSSGSGVGGTKASSSSASSGGSGGTSSSSRSTANRDAGSPADAVGTVSFANQIQPMLKSNCTSCHGSSRQSAGVRLDSYSAVKSNLSRVSNVISKGTMPPTGGLKTDLRQLFQTWVDQGALDN